MLKVICPITKRIFDCQNCQAIKEGEKCPYMVFDEAIEYTLEFLSKKRGEEKVEK